MLGRILLMISTTAMERI